MIHCRKFLRFYCYALVVGLLTGVLGCAFQTSILRAEHYHLHVISHFQSVFGVPRVITYILMTSILVMFAWWLVKRFAPTAAGSGVQEIEGALQHTRAQNWKRTLPVKFIGGIITISNQMVMGWEGPMIQMGGDIGQAVSKFLKLNQKRVDALVAAGAAAGLATAYNAPLAGVLFVMEEMRQAFNMTFIQYKAVAISCVGATIIAQLFLGSAPVIATDIFNMPAIGTLSYFALLGIWVGLGGVIFNHSLMATLEVLDRQSILNKMSYVLLISLLIGFLFWYWPEAVGGGYTIIERSLTLTPTLPWLIVLLMVRFSLTLLCYGTGVPGGIFAPMLALGTLLGLTFCKLFALMLPGLAELHSGMFAIAAMGALFSACVRAPITGIILVVEMTQNYQLILPLMVSSLTATAVVHIFGVSSIYALLLRRAKRHEKTP